VTPAESLKRLLPMLLCALACNKGVPARLEVGQLQGSGGAQVGALVARSAGARTAAAASTGAFSFAHVDGVRLRLLGVELQGGETNEAADWSGAPRTLDIGASRSAVSITDTVSLVPGSYAGASIRYDNAYEVKAYCVTAGRFVYTTLAGPKALAGGVPDPFPADYDYASYAFAEVSTAEGPASTTDTAMAATNATFSVPDSGGQIAILIDPSFTVSCYDGTLPSLTDQGTGALSPFTWSNNHGHAIADFFAADAPAFGMGYLPMFVWVDGDTTRPLPTTETYLVGRAGADVTADTLDFGKLGVVTTVFLEDGTLYAMRARVGGIGELYQYFSVAGHDGAAYTFYNGEFMCGGQEGCRYLHDRQLVGFSPTSDLATVRAVTLQDGPDCGKTCIDGSHPEWGNRCRPCLGQPETLYWKKVQP
jgi:hypothetical protein